MLPYIVASSSVYPTVDMINITGNSSTEMRSKSQQLRSPKKTEIAGGTLTVMSSSKRMVAKEKHGHHEIEREGEGGTRSWSSG